MTDYTVNALTGFAVGTAVIAGPSFSQCSTYLFAYGIQFVKIYEMHYAQYDLWMSTFNITQARIWPYLLINDEYIWLLANLYLLSDGCFYSGFEYYGSLLNYADWYEQPSLIAWNLLYNFGFIYSTIRDIVMYIMRDSRTLI